MVTKDALATPTFILTVGGAVLGGLALAGHGWAVVPAVACLATAGIGGVAIAIHQQVQAAGERWSVAGIARAMRRPWPQDVRRGLVTHLPQAIMAALILLRAWRRCKR